MDRREFLGLSAAGLLGLGMKFAPSLEGRCRDGKDYNLVILGDTHFDTEPESVYHSHYNEPKEWLNRVQREEFARLPGQRMIDAPRSCRFSTTSARIPWKWSAGRSETAPIAQ